MHGVLVFDIDLSFEIKAMSSNILPASVSPPFFLFAYNWP